MGNLGQAWGKLGEAGDRHPLTAHMLDVAACFLEVARQECVARALKYAAGRTLTSVDMMRLAAIAFLHDIGKANAGFQAKQWHRDEQGIPDGWPHQAGHTCEALFIFTDEKLASALPLEDMSQWGAACADLWRASISHHGSPVEDLTESNIKHLWKPVIQNGEVAYDPHANLTEIGQRLLEWFEPAFQKGPRLPDKPQFVHLFAGLVQFADWLGSDTHFFPYAEPTEDRNRTVWKRARNAVAHIGIDVQTWRDALATTLDFTKVFEVPTPRPIQAKMTGPGLGNLVILESETGSGKTEAALWHFVQLFKAGLVDSLFFALPTRVAATQIYNRTLTFVKNLWSDSTQEAPLVVRALSGYECANGEGILARLPNFQVLWADKPDEQRAHTRWAAESSKRFLAAPLAVGTIDQALLSVLQVRHAHMRHSLLARSLLVVDEVHASDAYMSALLEHLLKAHLNAGGRALLLSATLGSSASYRYRKLVAPQVPVPTLTQAIDAPYPAITDGSTTHEIPDAGQKKTVHWRVFDCIDQPSTVAELAISAAQQGAKVLVIRNTVPAALATFRAVEFQAKKNNLTKALFKVNDVATVHHSRYSREDRPLLDNAVEQQIGKDRAEPLEPCIVVGTQTLEQSLDIDADLLITDLCPMDVLLQRVGRLHRHLRLAPKRPKAFQDPQAVVLVPAKHSLESYLKQPRHGLGRFHNGGGIYTDLRILEATRRLISKSVTHNIPENNRELVERATHPEALNAVENELGIAWQEHGQAADGKTHAEKNMAVHSRLDFEKHFEDVNGNVLSFPTRDQQIASRLGASDYLLNFDPPPPGPFGHSIRALPVRHHLWPRGLDPDQQPKNLTLLPSGGFTFMLGPQLFSYSRLGLERIQSVNTSHDQVLEEVHD